MMMMITITIIYHARLDFLSTQKRVEISSPYDPVHLTHVGFNQETGEFTVKIQFLSFNLFLAYYFI